MCCSVVAFASATTVLLLGVVATGSRIVRFCPSSYDVAFVVTSSSASAFVVVVSASVPLLLKLLVILLLLLLLFLLPMFMLLLLLLALIQLFVRMCCQRLLLPSRYCFIAILSEGLCQQERGFKAREHPNCQQVHRKRVGRHGLVDRQR